MNWCLLSLTFLFFLCSFYTFALIAWHRNTEILSSAQMWFSSCFAAYKICLGLEANKQTDRQNGSQIYLHTQNNNKVKELCSRNTFTKAICLHLTVVGCHMPWADSSFMYFLLPYCMFYVTRCHLHKQHKHILTCGLLLFLLLILCYYYCYCWIEPTILRSVVCLM